MYKEVSISSKTRSLLFLLKVLNQVNFSVIKRAKVSTVCCAFLSSSKLYIVIGNIIILFSELSILYFISFLFCGYLICIKEGYPNSLKEYLFGYVQLGVALLDLVFFIGWYFGLFWGDFAGMLTMFYSLSP